MTCPCSSGIAYLECCHPFHEGIKKPLTARQLMRTRFSAYALGLTDYIMATTHPGYGAYHSNKKEWVKEILLFSQGTTFRRLEILSDQEGEEEASVTFTAYLNRGECDTTFTEISRFIKKEGSWLYADGKITPGALA